MGIDVDFTDKVCRYIKENKMISAGDCVVVGLSGGADSVSLLMVLGSLKERMAFELMALHVNHGIRGEEAMHDELFTKALCDRLGIRLKTVHIDVPALVQETHMSSEEAGRHARQDEFARLCAEIEKEKTAGRESGQIPGQTGRRVVVALAHHMDDQAETVLHNLVRGSALKGLAGMSPVNVMYGTCDGVRTGYTIIRPLLCVRRAAIEEWLRGHNQEYCTDSTNLGNDYTRNRLRNTIIPMLNDMVNANAVSNIASAAAFAKEAQDYINRQAEAAFAQCADVRERETVIDAVRLSQYDRIIRKYVVHMAIASEAKAAKDICAVHVESVEALIEAGTGSSVDIPYGLKARRRYSEIVIQKADMKCDGQNGGVDEHDGRWYSKNGWYAADRINLQKNAHSFQQNDYTKLIDYDKIKFNLQLRTRQEEDFICVYSDGRSKKLGRFMIEQKIPAEYRDRVLVVADGNEIVWIVGFRMSERYKAQDTTINTAMISVGNGSGGDDGEDIRINQPEGGGDKNSRDSRAD